MGDWLKIESSTVKEDGSFEVLEVAVTAGKTLDRFDAAIEPFGLSVGYRTAEVVQQSCDMTSQVFRCTDHWH